MAGDIFCGLVSQRIQPQNGSQIRSRKHAGWEQAPRYLIRDRGGAYGEVLTRRLRSIGICDRPTSPRSPWQNAYAERLIGSIRRECLDHVVVFSERHLRHILLSYMSYHNEIRTHYTHYPDNVVGHLVDQAAKAGMDLFRIFDCLNWVENMRVSIDAVVDSGKLAEGAICYTGDILDAARAKHSLRYYVSLAKELEAAGVHILGLKDMAGLLKPAAARVLVKALKEEVGLPIHFHTRDTSGIAGATRLAAVDAGVDAVDAAMDAMSGTTSQPTLGSIVEALVPHSKSNRCWRRP